MYMATNEDHMRTIHTLPDDALLQIFGVCRPEVETFTGRAFYLPSWPWHMLAHVCRRWRQVILAAPRRLGVQNHITHGSPVADILDHLPQLPLVTY
ncbi:hypothetical protein BC834DRAFT_908758 [Gloeopeniophorella convolvens]|nr:hypothetical protein BC834DRAFT_908758 [Gloeopeniophorella convolvens]